MSEPDVVRVFWVAKLPEGEELGGFCPPAPPIADDAAEGLQVSLSEEEFEAARKAEGWHYVQGQTLDGQPWSGWVTDDWERDGPER